MMRYLCVLAVAGVLTGCGEAAVDSGGGAVTAESDSCNARAHRDLVGRALDDMAAASEMAPKVRLIHPGDSVTQDMQEDRLNVVFDDEGRVTRVYCG